MADIFISYAREDQDRVEKLVSALEQQGWVVFWDRRIPSGQTWRSYIGKSLDDARCVVVAWSRHSVNSSWVIEEADDGKRRGVLVPVLLDPVEQPRGFREIQVADLTDWQPGRPSPRYDELAKDIHALLHGAQTRPNRKPVDSHPVASAAALDERNTQITPNASAKRIFFALAAGVFVISIVVVGYLRSTRTMPDSRVSRAIPAQESGSERDLEEKKVKVRPEPPAIASKTTVTKQSNGEQSRLYALRAVIKDPDGYTNVRRMKSSSSDIVTKIYEGEEFYTHAQDGTWWQIKTKDGKLGYMHVSRIDVLK